MSHNKKSSWNTSTQTNGQSSSSETATLLNKSENCSEQADTETVLKLDRDQFISILEKNNFATQGQLLKKVKQDFEDAVNCTVKIFRTFDDHGFALNDKFHLQFDTREDLVLFILRYM